MDWTPTADYERITEANRLFYKKVARVYDKTETCVADPEAQRKLEGILNEALVFLSKPAAEVNALDACGGTGNIALKLAARGIPVTLADVSPDQLEIYKEKCQKMGKEARTHCGDILAFLKSTPAKYDIIVFSSALHHIENYMAVLTLAYEALAPGGIIMTIYDPTLVSGRKSGTRMFLFLDYLTFKLRKQTSDLIPGVARRIKRTIRGRNPQEGGEIADESLGFLAEYHLTRGIDDHELVRGMVQRGAEVLWHQRESGGRYAITRKLVGLMGDATDFRTLFRKPAA